MNRTTVCVGTYASFLPQVNGGSRRMSTVGDFPLFESVF